MGRVGIDIIVQFTINRIQFLSTDLLHLDSISSLFFFKSRVVIRIGTGQQVDLDRSEAHWKTDGRRKRDG